MNEELRITIKAVTSDAQKNLANVKKELDGIETSAKSSGASADEAMQAMAKGAAAAAVAVTALVAAMTKLGKSAQEVNKGFAKLNTTFQNNGSTVKQATATYEKLYGFLGDHDKAIEAAQSLALITTEEKNLTEWSNILQGAYAEMGDKLPIEGLAEAANETINVGQVTGVLADALTWARISEDGFNAALEQTTSLEEREALVRSTLNGLYSSAAAIYQMNNAATIQYNQSQAALNAALAQASSYTLPLLTSLNSLGTTLLSVLGPAIRTISVYLTAFIQLLAEAVSWIGKFFNSISSSSSQSTADLEGYQNAMNDYLKALQKYFSRTETNIDNTIDAVQELKRQTMGFDELNVVSSPTATTTGGGGVNTGGGGIDLSDMPTAPNPLDYGIGTSATMSLGLDLSEFNKDVEEAKEKIQGVLTLVGFVAIGLLAWKITDFVSDLVLAIKYLPVINQSIANLSAAGIDTTAFKEAKEELEQVKNRAKKLLGQLMLISGAIITIIGYTDAWANGVDWDNLATMITGVGLAIGGVALAMGGAAALFMSVAAGAALLVVAIKDMITNGASVENVLLVVAAALLMIIPIIIAFNTALIANPIGLIITAIVALIAAIAALVVAFVLEEPAIKSVEEAQENLNEAKKAAQEAEMGYANAVDAAESALTRLQEAEAAAGMSGEELYEQVRNGTLDYKDMDAAQRELYKAYSDNLTKQEELEAAMNEMQTAREAEKMASWEHQLSLAKEGESYDEYKKKVVAAFEAGELSAEQARELLGKSMSEMSDDAQQTFMEDIPDSLRDGLDPSQYETTWKQITDWFSGVGESIVKNIWEPIKNWWNEKIAPIFTKKFWADLFDSIKQGIKAALNGAIECVENAINWIVDKLNTLSWDVPEWVPFIGGETFGFNIPHAKLPRLAEGGIVTSSTIANIGERGKEAVLPLENNTEWMDVLADRLVSKNGNQKIVLMLDGKELGHATIGAINNITKQTGRMPLTVMV